MTHRAGVRATIQIGRYVRPVSQVAAEIGVSWNTVMGEVMFYGGPLIDDPERLKTVNHPGVDETVPNQTQRGPCENELFRDTTEDNILALDNRAALTTKRCVFPNRAI